MKVNKSYILIAFTIICIALPFLLSPVPQDPQYHDFADKRTFFSINNFLNVISNIPFLVLGIIGLVIFFKKLETFTLTSFSFLALFIGVSGIGLGSAYYHYHPTNETLIWDRIPMTITFMSYFTIVLGQYVNKKLSEFLILPLIALGVASVVYWYLLELQGIGDLRFYGIIQFYPMIAIPLIVFLFPTSPSTKKKIVGIIVLYAIAKICEEMDDGIFEKGQIISGHSLKHLFASASVLLILLTVRPKKLTEGLFAPES